MRLCIFGDSITWGANDFEYGGWAAHLKNYLYRKDESDVYNLGISGDVTTQTLRRIDGEASARRAEAIIFALGVNDSAYVKSKNARWTPRDEFKKNLKLLHEKARMFTEGIFFIGLTPLDETKLQPAPFATDYYYDAKSRDEYNEYTRAFCEEKSIPFISMEGVLTLDDLSDGLHPNTDGHKKMFEKVTSEIEMRKLL